MFCICDTHNACHRWKNASSAKIGHSYSFRAFFFAWIISARLHFLNIVPHKCNTYTFLMSMPWFDTWHFSNKFCNLVWRRSTQFQFLFWINARLTGHYSNIIFGQPVFSFSDISVFIPRPTLVYIQQKLGALIVIVNEQRERGRVWLCFGFAHRQFDRLESDNDEAGKWLAFFQEIFGRMAAH